MQIETYKTVHIRNHFDGEDSFTFTLDIPFPVDEIAIVHVSMLDNNFNELGRILTLYQLVTDMLPSAKPFFSIDGPYYSTPTSIRYLTSDKRYSSTYTMRLLKSDGSVIDQTDNDEVVDVDIMLTLEFRKFSK